MERNEPILVPEWLKSSVGSATGNSGVSHPSFSSCQTHDRVSPVHVRSRSSLGVSNYDNPRPLSSYFHRSLSNKGFILNDKGSPTHIRHFGSFLRNYHDGDWENFDYSHSSMASFNIHSCQSGKDTLIRSQPVVSRKRDYMMPRSMPNGMNNGSVRCENSVKRNQNAVFERDFPSLGMEDYKQGVAEVSGRDKSLGLNVAAPNLPTCTSISTGGDGWTSALAEIPGIIARSCTLQQISLADNTPSSPKTNAGRNMAETLAQPPSRTHSTSQSSTSTKRFDELAMKLSRQLIPMTPSSPKVLITNSFEKPKAKLKVAESTAMTKISPQVSSSTVVHSSVYAPLASSDAPKMTSHFGGRLHILARERNDTTLKDGPSPINISKVPSTPVTGVSSPPFSPPSPQNTVIGKRISQARNRSDFFNSLRKKTSSNHHTAESQNENSMTSSSLVSMTRKEQQHIAAIDSSTTQELIKLSSSKCTSSDWSPENSNGDVYNVVTCLETPVSPCDGKTGSNLDVVDMTEKEIAFLRSLGWEEDGGDEELTEEEISSFYELIRDKGTRLPVVMALDPQ